MKRSKESCDVLVVGGGAAGISAAVSAARLGAQVLLVERYGFLGGMATAAEVGTICGLYLRQPRLEFVDAGFPKEFSEKVSRLSSTTARETVEHLWYLPYKPLAFKVASDEFLLEGRVKLILHSTLFEATQEDRLIKSLSLFVGDVIVEILPKVVIDCSGDGVVSSLLGNPVLSNWQQAGAYVISLAGLPYEDELLLGRSLTKVLLEKGASELAKRSSIVPGSLKRGVVSIKIAAPEVINASFMELSGIEVSARVNALKLFSILASVLPDLEIVSTAPQLGIRTTSRGEGRYVLTEEDVLSCRKFEDGIASGAWPIEEWGVEPGPKLTYFAESCTYDIPKAALQSKHTENLLFAGRCISASDKAIGSARVIGTCLSTGFAAGKLSSAFLST